MTPSERRKKLKDAEHMLKMTTKRIRRLVTAQKNWQHRVSYHTLALEKELAAAPVPHREGLLLPMVTGRKFRD